MSSMDRMLSGADSWVDVKGNGYLIVDNLGPHSPQDGFQTHVIDDMEWGRNNVFDPQYRHRQRCRRRVLHPPARGVGEHRRLLERGRGRRGRFHQPPRRVHGNRRSPQGIAGLIDNVLAVIRTVEMVTKS